MSSLRTKFTLLTVGSVIVTLTAATVLAALSIKRLGSNTSDQMLYLLCKTGERNLDYYLDSVEHSVGIISEYAQDDLDKTELTKLGEHLERVKSLFENTANNTVGIMTYYYRIDPTVSRKDKGFWYVDTDSQGFKEHEVTDITLYDTDDQTSLVWFTVPKATGKAIWLPPYVTENLGAYVLSYNVPIYKGDTFVGVIGIEIDYHTIAEPVDNITLYDNKGYAFVSDADGNIIYHPHIDLDILTSKNKPIVPDEMKKAETYVRYTYENVQKQAVRLKLENGMYINVTVPLSVINADWYMLINEIIITAVILIVITFVLTMRLAGHITKPLRKLTEAAEQVDAGNYEFTPEYNGKDEVGKLTRTFGKLVSHLKVYINELNNLAYADALTSVHNKGAFDIYMRQLKEETAQADRKTEFAIAVFDCNNLKQINDCFGHEKGDIYLKNICTLICATFKRSPVFRTGGDEFTVILQNDDFIRREELSKRFKSESERISGGAENDWEKVSAAIGVAVYDSACDYSVEDVVRRADDLMYIDKRKMKEK